MYDKSTGSSEITSYDSEKKEKLSIKDFEKIKHLGKGSFGEVYLAKNLNKNSLSALKILDINFINKLNRTHEPIIEKLILVELDHPFIIKLLSTFKDNQKLYFELEFAQNKDLSTFIRTQGIFEYELAKFYSAEIVVALEYLHKRGISHRDIKPENIMLDNNMHIKLIDFSSATYNGKYFDVKLKKFVKLDENKKNYINNLVGTPEYTSPETLNNSIDNHFSTDLWALGCIIYKFFHGKTPFKASCDYSIFENIRNLNYEISPKVPVEAKDIIEKLLTEDPRERLGVSYSDFNSFEKLKSHIFFQGIEFNTIFDSIPPIHNYYVFNSDETHIKDMDNSKVSEFNSNEINDSPIVETNHKCISNFFIDNYFIFNNDEITVVHEGLLMKNSSWINYKTRRLILYSNKALEYWNSQKIIFLGKIILNKDCMIRVKEKIFEIKNKNILWKFKAFSKDDALVWFEKIKNSIEEKI